MNEVIEPKAQKKEGKLGFLKKKEIKGGKKRELTWREKYGFFRIMWVYLLGVAFGASITFIYLEFPQVLETKTITIINEVKAQETEKTMQVEEEVMQKESDNVEELAEMIYKLESTSGKNNYSKCEAIGKINGIGYGIPGNGTYQCFESHEDEMKVLRGWIIDKKAKGMTDNELLCLYSGRNYKICK